jgi:hypothetical protein
MRGAVRSNAGVRFTAQLLRSYFLSCASLEKFELRLRLVIIKQEQSSVFVVFEGYTYMIRLCSHIPSPALIFGSGVLFQPKLHLGYAHDPV